MMAFMVGLVRGGWLPVGSGNHHSFYCEFRDYKCISMSSSSSFIYLFLVGFTLAMLYGLCFCFVPPSWVSTKAGLVLHEFCPKICINLFSFH